MAPLIHDFVLENCNSKFLISYKRYLIRSYVKIILEENSDANIKVYDFNNNDVFIMNKTNLVFENINSSKSLFLKSDKDNLIYIYYYTKKNLKIFDHSKNNNSSILILFSSDYENNKLKYSTDIGFKNYIPFTMKFSELEYSQISISNFGNYEFKFQKGEKYLTYFECEDGVNLVGNDSGFYENLALNEGSCLIEKNKDIYIHTSLDCIKNKIFYQIFECNEDNISENEYYTSINGNEIEK